MSRTASNIRSWKRQKGPSRGPSVLSALHHRLACPQHPDSLPWQPGYSSQLPCTSCGVRAEPQLHHAGPFTTPVKRQLSCPHHPVSPKAPWGGAPCRPRPCENNGPQLPGAGGAWNAWVEIMASTWGRPRENVCLTCPAHLFSEG